MPKKNSIGLNIFYQSLMTLAGLGIFFVFVFPYLSQWIAGSENPLPVPSTLMFIYLILAVVGILVYVASDPDRLHEFCKPLIELLEGRERIETRGDRIHQNVRAVVLVAFPLLVGWVLFDHAAPGMRAPTSLRIQHPTIPQSFERLENPFRKGSAEQIEQAILEGRVLYQKNCRPCHGTKAAGDGPMARAFRLKPANFRDPGTIATVVEAYAFWRIKKGAPALPREASPWDSAMPVWENDLTDVEIWKIIMAEYQTAGVEPRKPENLEER